MANVVCTSLTQKALMRLRPIFVIVPVFLSACGPTARVEVPVAHPAHPDAVESPVPERSQTLVAGPSLLAIPPLSPAAVDGDEHSHHHDHPKDP